MSRRWHPGGLAVAAVVASLALAAAIPGAAGSAAGDQVTITLIASNLDQSGYQALIANFERVYPNITVTGTYPPNATIAQIEPIELGAGNAPDLLATNPGESIVDFAKAGWLAPMLKVPWTKRSLPLVTSLNKYGGALLGFEPGVSLMGMFTNDALFQKLGLKIPQTYSQLLSVCQKAKADGVIPVFVDTTLVMPFIDDLAVPLVFAQDKHWFAKLRAGTVSFDGTAGWHQTLQEFVDMSNAGCFEPGVTGSETGVGQFAVGQVLMDLGTTANKNVIDQTNPQFTYSFHAIPGGSTPDATEVFASPSDNLSINAHSSPAAQAAAQTFINFVARPKQNALYEQIRGSLTQYQLLKGQVPSWMPAMAPIVAKHEYVINPGTFFWNASVGSALRQNVIGLLTGQTTIDGVLNAMDAAWKLGPA
jgi:raffinose/stachyose/melibiose transport system substrate-binding protein